MDQHFYDMKENLKSLRKQAFENAATMIPVQTICALDGKETVQDLYRIIAILRGQIQFRDGILRNVEKPFEEAFKTYHALERKREDFIAYKMEVEDLQKIRKTRDWTIRRLRAENRFLLDIIS